MKASSFRLMGTGSLPHSPPFCLPAVGVGYSKLGMRYCILRAACVRRSVRRQCEDLCPSDQEAALRLRSGRERMKTFWERNFVEVDV